MNVIKMLEDERTKFETISNEYGDWFVSATLVCEDFECHVSDNYFYYIDENDVEVAREMTEKENEIWHEKENDEIRGKIEYLQECKDWEETMESLSANRLNRI